jgi:predicted NBD/HSP70 family sugar kinase
MQDLKKNELYVLKTIFSHGDATRLHIAKVTKLSLALISSILGKLRGYRYIVKKGTTQSVSGRPSTIYQIRSDLGHSFGISVKPNSVRFVVVDFSKEVIFEKNYQLSLSPDPGTHTSDIITQISQRMADILKEPPIIQLPIVSVGIALPGMVDTTRNIWLQGMHMSGVTHINVGAELKKSINMPIYIEDESRALAYREKFMGHGQGQEKFVLLYLDEGMGAGIINHDEIYTGYHGLSGEIGHISHPGSSYRCSCNNIGCLETILSIQGIIRIFRERLKEGVRSTLHKYFKENEIDLSLECIRAAADQGDRLAQTTLFEIGQYLGDAVVILVKMFNPQRIIISGSVSVFKDYFRDPIHLVLNQQVHSEMLHDFSVHFSNYEVNHEAHGAALIGLFNYLSRK